MCVFGLMLWLFSVLGGFLVKTHSLMFTFACLLLFVCGLFCSVCYVCLCVLLLFVFFVVCVSLV